MGDVRDRPTDTVEVTEAMVEAGFTVLWESGAIETFNEDLDRLLVHRIFVAMCLVGGGRS